MLLHDREVNLPGSNLYCSYRIVREPARHFCLCLHNAVLSDGPILLPQKALGAPACLAVFSASENPKLEDQLILHNFASLGSIKTLIN